MINDNLTERLEIRISRVEKAYLTNLAKQKNTTISHIVRLAILSLSSYEKEKKPSSIILDDSNT